ncbi:substrate-binding domain-containing protein [Paenarthrobacter sp. CM16]|uniref:substrate-binding domain-containing protein n=1 Tax=Paenarthrobacter sp. CM16 TaxID=2738447 RepID=UPI0015550E4E|nr:substrate-binding domain-containing protein [Paenarthrobacter sp. CM16]NQD89709.1 substrate-binding domain-containing protein [Paenarthrobacter sp. CM16]
MTSPSAREQAIGRVAAGESVKDVALRFNIQPVALQRWVAEETGVEGLIPAEQPAVRNGHVTIVDVARRANLSKSVVSRALRGQYGVSNEARKKVEQAARELGFVFNAAAQNLSSYRTNTIGVLVRDASAAFYGEMQSALQKRGTQVQNRVFITSGALDNHDERRALEDLIALRVDGLIVCSGRLPAEEVKRFSDRFPVVVAGRPEADPALNSVFGDEDAGAADLAQHLIDLGHREIGVLQPSISASPILHRRTNVMAEELTRRGAIPHLLPVESAESAPESLDSTPGTITALMCPNDRYAAVCLELFEQGRPRLAITGFDGVGGLASNLIGITTWRQPIDEIGTAAVDLLMKVIAEPGRPVERLAIPGQLRASRSTAAI